MDSYILEDINALLNLKKGDSTRLNQIKQLCQANEIVSISDRKYIERLVNQYIRKTKPVEELKTQPKPQIQPIKETNIPTPPEFEKKTSENQMLEKMQPPEYSKFEKTRAAFEFSHNKKILFGIGAIILAVILVAVVAIGYDGIPAIDDSNVDKGTTLPGVSLEIDESSYETADIISISGKVSSSSGTVSLTILNEKGNPIWEENLSIKKNGEFSTLLIGGGPGWENSGRYTLKGEHGGLSNEISFDFTSK